VVRATNKTSNIEQKAQDRFV